MTFDLIQRRLKEYDCKSGIDEENAIKEISQELALYAVSRTDFFKYGKFHGGTCLRILYSLNRYSEDLDFVLMKKNENFSWKPYLDSIVNEFSNYGYQVEVKSRDEVGGAVRKAFIKDDSIINVLELEHLRPTRSTKKIKIKLEVDTNPPEGSVYETKHLDFPLSCSITTQELSSSFASKSAAILCRKFLKGRDWFDFIWYVSRKTPINFELLSSSLDQIGPWENQSISADRDWYLKTMEQKISEVDWELAKTDVTKFLKPRDRVSLDTWSTDYFSVLLDKLDKYL